MNAPATEIATAAQLGLHGCPTCGCVYELGAGQRGAATAAGSPVRLRCTRCHTRLRYRKRHSLQRTWAYLAAAVLLYVPANVLPIMTTSTLFGGSTRHTILGGIEELWLSGDLMLAAIVFIASIAVPMLKVGALALLAATAQRRSRWRSAERAQLFRMVEAVGHWSMLDIYVVVLLVGMVRFGFLAGVQPEAGLLAFGTVVVLTMLATESFDPRLLWPDPALEHD